jgi:hypothetical protein
MRKFEHFEPKVYLFGPRWAFGAAFGVHGWKTAASHTKFSAGSLLNDLKIAYAGGFLGASGDALIKLDRGGAAGPGVLPS